MKISFTPVRRDDLLSLIVDGDTLTINDEAFDFTPLSEGQTLPRADVPCDWLTSDVERINGEIHLTLILPHGAKAPQETRFPQPITANDGPVSVPPHSLSEETTT